MIDVASAYEDQTILITGGAGCVGSNLTKKLAEYNPKKIIVLDNLSSAYTWNIPKLDCVEFIEGDICDDQVLKWVFKQNPDYVFHLAAHFANQNSVDKPELDLKVNGLGILKVLEYAQLTGVKRFVYSSSGCGVYGLESKMPFEEHDRNVIPNFMYWAMNGQALPITGNGSETRDWTYIDDILQGLTRLGVVEEAIGESINLGSGVDHRVIDMANKVNELCGNEAGVEYKERRNWDAKNKLLSSIDKAKRILDYKPQHTFEEGLENTHEWFVENWDNIQKSAEF